MLAVTSVELTAVPLTISAAMTSGFGSSYLYRHGSALFTDSGTSSAGSGTPVCVSVCVCECVGECVCVFEFESVCVSVSVTKCVLLFNANCYALTASMQIQSYEVKPNQIRSN